LEDTNIRIILKWFPRKLDGTVWARLVWLRETNDAFSKQGVEPSVYKLFSM
jgi:hypothetical protein